MDRRAPHTLWSTFDWARSEQEGESSGIEGHAARLRRLPGRRRRDRGISRRADISGERGRPVVFKKVKFAVELSGRFKATNAVFEECSFNKTGGWFVDSYSAKFEFSNSLLVDSKFDDLSRVDYGFKFNGCAMVNCKLSDRKNDDKHDSFKVTTSDWSQIRDCDFYNCQLASSTVWCMKTSNLFACEILQKVCDYHSSTSLPVTLGLPKSEIKQILEDLASRTKNSDTGQVTFQPADAIYAHPASSVLR